MTYHLNDDHYPDVGAVRAQARAAWERRQRRRASIQERVEASVPWWLMAIAAVFYALSVPHTALVFNWITPGVGKLASIAFEFGLLYLAFRRRRDNAAGKRIPLYLWLLGGLIFIVSIIANGVGAFAAIVRTAGLGEMPLGALTDAYSQLPAPQQVALLLVPLAALVIPIGTLVAGEGLAYLFLERRAAGDPLENRWRVDGPRVEYEALRDAALALGHTPKAAARWAAGITGYDPARLSPVTRLSVRADSSGQYGQPADSADSSGQYGQPTDSSGQYGQPADSADSSGQYGQQRTPDARARIRRYLEAHPDEVPLLTARRLGDLTGTSKTVSAEELARWRQTVSGNGHRTGGI